MNLAEMEPHPAVRPVRALGYDDVEPTLPFSQITYPLQEVMYHLLRTIYVFEDTRRYPIPAPGCQKFIADYSCSFVKKFSPIDETRHLIRVYGR